ncbi:hypothetical protein RJJ65_07065 [Rhizobium hidalgonense]|uniref:Uncharacterized protein n=1 Tax=Rhizobium hidalgonense TaxID=1538159 RepID=A0A2A6KEM5_9HYPH|nr:hypothetical protein [Rhizobium hidalgonense]MDR9772416.1 hypothetical protein [Rhizobium hidalgonense]MDR9822792.1 hypothetical protein [Rhizobium hidalgonense]PDT23143.1 hypothetical protein CO674_11780 [Rhizobium hidalgonense]PON02344.1 hypothetical protein ATY29_32120 [Rhizobium hidalgonense]
MDDHFTQYLKCDVELNFTGPSPAVLNKWAADVLRALADRIEKQEFDDGHHEVKDRVGKPVGTIYVDYSEGDEL